MSGYHPETTARIIDAIDRGLADLPAPVYTDMHHCARCGATTTTGEHCGPCRAFLLGDTDVDPVPTATAIVTAERHIIAHLQQATGRDEPAELSEARLRFQSFDRMAIDARHAWKTAPRWRLFLRCYLKAVYEAMDQRADAEWACYESLYYGETS